MAKTVIVHGWSDCSDSFKGMKGFLVENGLGSAETVLYADYESREDDFSFEDAADGLNDQFIERGLIDASGKKLEDVNVIVHSTGGLVIRHWLWRYYLKDGNRVGDCPVRRIVMLAPANFGSPLAHRGKSFLGSLVKGRWKVGDFLEVGRKLLNGLELASPYQWELAHNDLLVDDGLYGPDKVQVTVLVGGDDYEGLRGWVNKAGTDGTVVIAGTSLDSVKFVLDCCRPRRADGTWEPYGWARTKAFNDIAFGVVPGLDHGSIVSSVGKDGGVGHWLVRALQVEGVAAFSTLKKELADLTAQTYAGGKDVFQQFVVHAVDDQENPVRDFALEFFLCRANRRGPSGELDTEKPLDHLESKLSDAANILLTCEGHQHSQDASYRRFLVSVRRMQALLEKAKADLGGEVVLGLRAYAPPIDRNIRYDVERLQSIVVMDTGKPDEDGPSFLFKNTTTLLELWINRVNHYVRVGQDPRQH